MHHPYVTECKTLFPHPCGTHSSRVTAIIPWEKLSIVSSLNCDESNPSSQTSFFHMSAVGATTAHTLLERSSWPPWSLHAYLLIIPQCFFAYFLMFSTFSLNSMTKHSPWNVDTQAPSARAGVLVERGHAESQPGGYRCQRSCRERCSQVSVCKALLRLATSIAHFICIHISNWHCSA